MSSRELKPTSRLSYLSSGDLLLTTGYFFREDEALQRQLIRELSELNCVGLAIKTRRYFDEIPEIMLEEANRLGFPLIEIPVQYPLSKICKVVFERLSGYGEEKTDRIISLYHSITASMMEPDGTSRMLEVLGGFVGNTVLLLGAGWELIDYAESAGDPMPPARHLSLQKGEVVFPGEITDNMPSILAATEACTQLISAEQMQYLPGRGDSFVVQSQRRILAFRQQLRITVLAQADETAAVLAKHLQLHRSGIECLFCDPVQKLHPATCPENLREFILRCAEHLECPSCSVNQHLPLSRLETENRIEGASRHPFLETEFLLLHLFSFFSSVNIAEKRVPASLQNAFLSVFLRYFRFRGNRKQRLLQIAWRIKFPKCET